MGDTAQGRSADRGQDRAPVVTQGRATDVMQERAAAKVNLHLHVTGRREDGYHLLDSLVVFADAADALSVRPADDLSLELSGPFASGLAAEPDNLVLRAAGLLAGHVGIRPTGRLSLEKNLPVASGIGGGSADAAAALRLLCRFWGIAPGEAELHAIALALGADVPACLAGRPCLMSGIGEALAPAPPLPACGLLLANPGTAVPTPAVFRARSGPFSPPARIPAEGWPDAQALAAWLRGTENDLQPPAVAIAPVIGDVLAAIRDLPGCLLARMSGSGATCYGLFATKAESVLAATRLAGRGWWVSAGGLSR